MLEAVIVGPFPDDPNRVKGGVQASVYGLARTLKQFPDLAGVRVVSLPIKGEASSGRCEIEGIRVDYLNMPWRYMASATVHVPRIAREILANPEAVAHIHGTGVVQAALSLYLWLARRHFVWTLHGITELETKKTYDLSPTFGNLCRHILYRWMERMQTSISPIVIVDTPYVAEALRRKKDVHVIPQGIFIEEIEGLAPTRVRQPLILSLGVISPRKGHDKLILAFAKIAKDYPETQLAIVGALTDQGYFNHLEALASENGVANQVKFHVNAHRQLVLELLSQACLFALHSQEESQGIALCEALLAGIPVVATSVGGIPYVVTEGSDGFLTPYGDLDGFANSISRLLSDAAMRDQMAQAAAENSRRFGWNAIFRRILDLYQG